MITIEVKNVENTVRIDHFLSLSLPDYTRSFFQKLIVAGSVQRNTTPVTKASVLVKNGDIITIESIDQQERSVDLGTIREDFWHTNLIAETDHFIVINKPSNLIVHPTSEESAQIALSDLLCQRYPEIKSIGETDRPGIVHRLDKHTTGIILAARTEHGYTTLKDLFKDRHITKAYKAIVVGCPPQEGIIDKPIQRHPVNRCRMCCPIVGRPALTEYKVERVYPRYTLITAYPKTGRTHQIRLHMASIGFPILGDIIYGKKSKLIDRQALHAHSIAFTFDGTDYNFSCPLPGDMKELLV